MALTEEQLQEAAKLWRDGLSTAQIAARFNTTRNAMAGYMNRDRDRFPAKGKHQGRPRRDGTPAQARPKPEKPKTWLQRAQKTLAAQDEIAAAIRPPEIQESSSDIPVHVATKDFTALRSFEQLESKECKWPIGDSAFQACGRQVVPGKPYCQAHCNLSYVPRKASTNRSYR